MEGLTLLKRAHDSGLTIALKGGDLIIQGPKSRSALVDEIARHKPEVVAALREREALAKAAAWNRLAGERWGDASAAPGIVVPSDHWRWEVACWPIARWLVWHRRVDELLATEPEIEAGPEPDPDAMAQAQARAERAEACQRRAYDEMIAAVPDEPLRTPASSD